METLEETKVRLGRDFIGQNGIHGVGISKAKNAVRLYVHDELKAQLVIDKIRSAAKPYDVIVQTEMPPAITAH